ncbi:MAG: hypothetical protein IT437_02450 [Phycisphaerales bacterium]|nr:hypothetical protein [Phycisphaerales bacterium]
MAMPATQGRAAERRLAVLATVYDASAAASSRELVENKDVSARCGLSLAEVNGHLDYWHEKGFVEHYAVFSGHGSSRLTAAGIDACERSQAAPGASTTATISQVNQGVQVGVFVNQTAGGNIGSGLFSGLVKWLKSLLGL